MIVIPRLVMNMTRNITIYIDHGNYTDYDDYKIYTDYAHYANYAEK